MCYYCFEDPRGEEFLCKKCKCSYFSKWNLRRHVFQRHDMYVPDDGGAWRPPTEVERKEMTSKLERGSKRKGADATVAASPQKQGGEEELEPPELQPQPEGPSLETAFNPDALLNLDTSYDPLLGGLTQDSGDEAIRSEHAMIRMVTTVGPSSAPPACLPAAAGVAPVCTTVATGIPRTQSVSAEPDQILTPEEMVELLASNPELDINSYGRFVAREHNLDEASVEGIKNSLERCRRHLKHYAETLLLDSLESRIGNTADPDKEVIMRLLKQTGRASS